MEKSSPFIGTSCVYVSVPELKGEVMGHRFSTTEDDYEASRHLEDGIRKLETIVRRFNGRKLLSYSMTEHHINSIPYQDGDKVPQHTGIRAVPELLAASRLASGLRLETGSYVNAKVWGRVNKSLCEAYEVDVPIPHWVDSSDLSELARVRHNTRRSSNYIHKERALLKRLFSGENDNVLPVGIDNVLDVAEAMIVIPLERLASKLENSSNRRRVQLPEIDHAVSLEELVATTGFDDEIVAQCMDLLSIDEETLLGVDARKFFDGTHPLREYSVIRLNSGHFINYGGSKIFLSLRDRLENYLKDSGKFGHYEPRRSKEVEKLASEFLQRIIHPEKIFPGFMYDYTEGSKAGHFEADIVMQTGTALFVIEVKAGGLPAPAKRGLPNRTRSGMYKLVGAGARQAERFALAVDAEQSDTFRGSSHGTPAELNLEGLTHVIPIVITLDDVSGLVGDSETLVDAGIFPSRDRPPLVFTLADLEIVSDLFSSPVDLIYHWEFRKALGEWDLICQDEIDLVLYDLRYGGEWLKGNLPRAIPMVVNSISYEIDAHYFVNEIPKLPNEFAQPLPTRTLSKAGSTQPDEKSTGFIQDSLQKLAEGYAYVTPALHFSLSTWVDYSDDELKIFENRWGGLLERLEERATGRLMDVYVGRVPATDAVNASSDE